MNINSIRNKIISLRELVNKAPIDILCIDETKIDQSFPDSQFFIKNYEFPPYRGDRNSEGGGKIVYVTQGFISKRLKSFESKNIETICIELTTSKKLVYIVCIQTSKLCKKSISLRTYRTAQVL